jgi:hypothetical protein
MMDFEMVGIYGEMQCDGHRADGRTLIWQIWSK